MVYILCLWVCLFSIDFLCPLYGSEEIHESVQEISEDQKKDYHRFDGPSKFIKELQENPSWNLINLHNFRILVDKPSSSGITIINRKK